MKISSGTLNHIDKNVYRTLLVWDGEDSPPVGEWFTALWRGFGKDDDDSVYSIPRLVEEKSDVLRSRFLGWIYDLGEAQINGRRLVDYLTLRLGFSYWWMTLIAEKCNFAKSPQIYDAVRLLALEELISSHPVGRIILASSDKILVRVVREWCGQADMEFEWRCLEDRANTVSWIRKLYCSLPHPAQALVFLLRYLRQRWPLKQSGTFSRSSVSGEITIVDYLAHLRPTALVTGRYSSNFWTDLITTLDHDAVRVNWLHHYVDHATVPTAQIARELINRFNQNSTGMQFHATLDGALTWSVVMGAISDYARIILMGMRLRKIQPHFKPKNSKVNLWPLFESDWGNSIFGATAMSNCLFLNLFERTLKCLPYQKLGVYLQENIAWEMAFVHAWRAAGHGELVGVPHATVKYWDLRYFSDPRSYKRTGNNDLPLPDFVALNGLPSVAAYRKGGFPEDKIVEVEALRYLHLANLLPERKPSRKLQAATNRVLILGDYLLSVTRQQIKWLMAAVPMLLPDTHFNFIVKPHPLCPVIANEYPSLQLQITDAPLADLFGDCDMVYTSNVTSASVDAYCAGITVVSVLDGDAFNMSPLRGLAGVTYVTSPSELADALSCFPERSGLGAEPYFFLNEKLPRWRHLLGMSEYLPSKADSILS